MTEAYPLQWPDGWPRTEYQDQKYSLPGGAVRQSWDRVVNRLLDELRRLGATNVVLSTNQPIRRDGLPYTTKRIIEDPGAAVYFSLDGQQLAMAQDCYMHLIDNIRSLALAIEGLRQMDRHGGGHMMKRAFSGFAALPPPDAIIPDDWRAVLEVGMGTCLDECETQYRTLAREAGEGDPQLYALNAAIMEARQRLG